VFVDLQLKTGTIISEHFAKSISCSISLFGEMN
jgi:hypothetical protein